jgi:hypothetical protein
MKLSFAHSNVAAVEGAWPVMGFTSHHNSCMVGLEVVLLGAPTSLANILWWSVRTTPPCVTHVRGSSEVGQREHMVRLGIHRKCWSEFPCLGGYLAPASVLLAVRR